MDERRGVCLYQADLTLCIIASWGGGWLLRFGAVASRGATRLLLDWGRFLSLPETVRVKSE